MVEVLLEVLVEVKTTHKDLDEMLTVITEQTLQIMFDKLEELEEVEEQVEIEEVTDDVYTYTLRHLLDRVL